MYYKIGDFSRLTNISIRTLRYYDEIGILKPEYVDPYSGYRYYTDKNLDEVRSITFLKQLSFSLEEIAQYKDSLTSEVLEYKKNQLIEKRNEIDEQIAMINSLNNEIVKPYNNKNDVKVLSLKKSA
jgi:DNA-binding transcriptional MerR regulator